MSGNTDRIVRERMIENLKKIQKLINLGIWQEDVFMTSSGEWVKYRRKTIKVFDEVLKDLGTAFKATSVARAGGAGVGVLGGGAALVGYGLSFSPNPAAKLLGDQLVKYGGGAGVLGGITAGSACVADAWLSQNAINKVNDALREDKFQTTVLCSWYQRSQELENLFQQVYGCSIVSDTRRNLFNAIEELNLICDRGGETLTNVIAVLSRSGDQLFERGLNLKHINGVIKHASYTILQLLREFCTDPRVRQSVLTISDAFKKSPIIFEIAKVVIVNGAKAAFQQGIILMLMPAAAQVACEAACQIVQGALIAVVLALSVWSLISAIKDINNEEFNYMKMVKEVKKCLISELDCLTDQFPNLK